MYWCSDKDIEIVKIENRYIALFGWNGEKYCDCFEVEEVVNGVGFGIKKENIIVKQVVSFYDSDSYDVVGYEIV